MRIVATSDLHGHLPEIPECDLLIIAGDVCPVENHERKFQADWLRGTFADWMRAQPAVSTVWIGGNHDFVLEDWRGKTDKLAQLPALYLDNSWMEVYPTDEPVKIWGTALSNRFGGWAFMADEDQLSDVYKTIPRDIDILITHGPVYGHGDLMPAVSWSAIKRGWEDLDTGQRLGSTSLLNQLQYDEWPNLKLIVSGHIHEDYGKHSLVVSGRSVPVLNAAHRDGAYDPVNPPLEIEL